MEVGDQYRIGCVYAARVKDLLAVRGDRRRPHLRLSRKTRNALRSLRRSAGGADRLHPYTGNLVFGYSIDHVFPVLRPFQLVSAIGHSSDSFVGDVVLTAYLSAFKTYDHNLGGLRRIRPVKSGHGQIVRRNLRGLHEFLGQWSGSSAVDPDSHHAANARSVGVKGKFSVGRASRENIEISGAQLLRVSAINVGAPDG